MQKHALLDISKAMNATSQVLGHLARVDAVHASGLQGHAELGQVRVIVQLSAMSQAPGPSINTSDGVSRGFLAFLMLPIMPSHGSMSGLGLNSLAIGTNQNGGHES